MLSLGHSIRNGSAGNIFDRNYAVEKECSCILSLKWLCISNKFTKKAGLLSMPSKFEDQICKWTW